MNTIFLTPYTLIENTDYPTDTKIVIRASDFENVLFQDGRITFSFINCRFKKLEIENSDTIEFKNISIQFIGCYIEEITVENIITTNLSIFFGSSILQGRIKNSNLLSVTVNNCFLNNSLFLLDLKIAVVSFTEENIYPVRWKRLLKSVNTTLENLLLEKQSFYIYDCKEIVFNFNENSTDKIDFTKDHILIISKIKLATFRAKQKRKILRSV